MRTDEKGRDIIRGGKSRKCIKCGRLDREFYTSLKGNTCITCIREKAREDYYRKKGLPVPPTKPKKRASKEKTEGIQLGFEVLEKVAAEHPGVTFTQADMADVCGCSRELMSKAEKTGLKKLRKWMSDALRDEFAQFI